MQLQLQYCRVEDTCIFSPDMTRHTMTRLCYDTLQCTAWKYCSMTRSIHEKRTLENEIVMAEVTDTCCYILIYCLDIFSHILSLTENEDFICITQYKQCG